MLKGGKLKAVPVKFGISDGRYTAVTSSELKAGDPVVVRATLQESGTQTPARPMMPRM